MDPVTLTAKAQIFATFAFLGIAGVALFEYGCRQNFHKLSLAIVATVTSALLIGSLLLPFWFM